MYKIGFWSRFSRKVCLPSPTNSSDIIFIALHFSFYFKKIDLIIINIFIDFYVLLWFQSYFQNGFSGQICSPHLKYWCNMVFLLLSSVNIYTFISYREAEFVCLFCFFCLHYYKTKITASLFTMDTDWFFPHTFFKGVHQELMMTQSSTAWFLMQVGRLQRLVLSHSNPLFLLLWSQGTQVCVIWEEKVGLE